MLKILLTIICIAVSCPGFLHARTITFADCQWDVKDSNGQLWGPGPNYFSDSSNNVWVDDDGRLHLKITKQGDRWNCAEIVSDKPTAYGLHRFYIATRVDLLDPHTCASPFLYKNDNAEIDIEFRQSNSNKHNSQYVIQPYNNPGNLVSFKSIQKGDYSTHYFDWTSDSISFKSFHGHYPEPPNPDHIINEWIYKGSDIPSSNLDLHVRINLYLVPGKNAPLNGKEVEFVVAAADLPTISIPNNDQPDSPPNTSVHQSCSGLMILFFIPFAASIIL